MACDRSYADVVSSKVGMVWYRACVYVYVGVTLVMRSPCADVPLQSDAKKANKLAKNGKKGLKDGVRLSSNASAAHGLLFLCVRLERGFSAGRSACFGLVWGVENSFLGGFSSPTRLCSSYFGGETGNRDRSSWRNGSWGTFQGWNGDILSFLVLFFQLRPWIVKWKSYCRRTFIQFVVGLTVR